MQSLWKWSLAGHVRDILVNMCHWNQPGGRVMHLSREARGCSHGGCLVARTGWLTINLTSSRRHELSDCKWEINCFPAVWPGCRCAGKVHAQHAKERSWLGGKFCCLPLRDEVLPFSFPDDQTVWGRICLFLCSKKKSENKVPGDYLCPDLQSPVFQCVSTGCEREDICGCAFFIDTNSPPLSLGTRTVKWECWRPFWPCRTDMCVRAMLVPFRGRDGADWPHSNLPRRNLLGEFWWMFH